MPRLCSNHLQELKFNEQWWQKANWLPTKAECDCDQTKNQTCLLVWHVSGPSGDPAAQVDHLTCNTQFAGQWQWALGAQCNRMFHGWGQPVNYGLSNVIWLWILITRNRLTNQYSDSDYDHHWLSLYPVSWQSVGFCNDWNWNDSQFSSLLSTSIHI